MPQFASLQNKDNELTCLNEPLCKGVRTAPAAGCPPSARDVAIRSAAPRDLAPPCPAGPKFRRIHYLPAEPTLRVPCFMEQLVLLPPDAPLWPPTIPGTHCSPHSKRPAPNLPSPRPTTPKGYAHREPSRLLGGPQAPWRLVGVALDAEYVTVEHRGQKHGLWGDRPSLGYGLAG